MKTQCDIQKAIRKAVAAAAREDFFARPGATLAQYRGTASVQVNRKHKANREHCRQSVQKED